MSRSDKDGVVLGSENKSHLQGSVDSRESRQQSEGVQRSAAPVQRSPTGQEYSTSIVRVPAWLAYAWDNELRLASRRYPGPEVGSLEIDALPCLDLIRSPGQPPRPVTISEYGSVLETLLQTQSSSDRRTVRSVIKEFLVLSYRTFPELADLLALEMKATEESNKTRSYFDKYKLSSVGWATTYVVRQMGALQATQLSLVFRSLARALVSIQGEFQASQGAVEELYLYVTERMKADLGPNHSETTDTISEFAQFYLYHLFDINGKATFKARKSLSDQEEMILMQLEVLEKGLGETHPDVLRFLDALGNWYIDAGMEDDSEAVFKETLTRRKAIFGPYHKETLLSVESLRNLYLGQERYLEVDAVVQGSLDPGLIFPTSRTSNNYSFWKWYQEDDGLQGKLATLMTPGQDMYWEDSRMYLNEIRQIELSPVSLQDPFPQAPLKVTVKGNQIAIDMSPQHLHDAGILPAEKSVDNLTDQLRKTDIWNLLASKSSKNDWDIFQTKSNRVFSEGVEMQPEQFQWRRYSLLQPDQNQPRPNAFWIFPEDLVQEDEGGPASQHYRTSWVNYLRSHGWNPSIGTGKDYSPKYLYLFDKVLASDSEWTVIGIRPDFGEGERVRYSFDDIDFRDYLPNGFASNQLHYHKIGLLDPKSMEYVIQDIAPGSAISISLPYVTYERFKDTQGYRHGLSYVDYIKALRLKLFQTWGKQDEILKFKSKMCKFEMQQDERGPFPRLEVTVASPRNSLRNSSRLYWRKVRRPWNKSSVFAQSDVDSVIVQGFLNGVPGDSAVLDNAKLMEGYNLVSSTWTEWKRFTLHQAPPNFTPQLQLANSESVVCRGYISGTWTDHGLNTSWVGIKLFVVDAVFVVGSSDRPHHFLFGPGALNEMNQHQLSNCEKRFMCGALNPALFRFAKAEWVHLGSVFKKMGVGKTRELELDPKRTFSDEMNRREKWDRKFERKMMAAESHDLSDDLGKIREILDEERAQEDKQRQQWDAQHDEADQF